MAHGQHNGDQWKILDGNLPLILLYSLKKGNRFYSTTYNERRYFHNTEMGQYQPDPEPDLHQDT
jgi:hypothetical protein